RRTLACQYGSRAELAMMLDRQSKPIETSWPKGVVNPLWQARQRSEVWNATFESFCELDSLISTRGNPSSANATISCQAGLPINNSLTNLHSNAHPANPRGDRTRSVWLVPHCCSPALGPPNHPGYVVFCLL